MKYSEKVADVEHGEVCKLVDGDEEVKDESEGCDTLTKLYLFTLTPVVVKD